MATALDLQEQEQLDELKAFWKRWGNLISGVLTAVLLAYAAWNGWNWYQRDQGAKAAALYELVDQAATTGDVDRAKRAFDDLVARHPKTLVASQSALRVAALQAARGQAEPARATLDWLVAHAHDDGYAAIARLRLAGLAMDAKQWDVATKALQDVKSPEFAPLAADRRGDIALAQGKRDEAKEAYRKAHADLPATQPYRRVVEAKLTALGVTPPADVTVQPVGRGS